MEQQKIKLSVKKTLTIGLAFFTIMLFWQVYNSNVSLMLKNLLATRLGDKVNYIVGIIMALDNIAALVMLPLFGKLSDKIKTPIGKRMPFIIGGTLLASLTFILVPILYLSNNLVGMIVIIALCIIFMNIYRSPAVALMPDVTIKPLRSKANGLINLMGGIGAGLMMLFMMFIPKLISSDAIALSVPFYVASALMIVGVVIMFFTVKENKLSGEMQQLSNQLQLETSDKAEDAIKGFEKDENLVGQKKKNMLLILGGVFMWFMAFNAIETFLGIYCSEVLCLPLRATMDEQAYLNYARGQSSTIMLFFQIAAMAAYIPAAIVAAKLGRKKTIIIGIIITIFMFAPAVFFSEFTWWLLPLFILAGFSYAAINVNSYPMVVEMSSTQTIGKYTGYYYTASMLAQSLTPIAIGGLFDIMGYRYAFFPYATIFMALALVMILFVGAGKKSKKTIQNQGVEESAEKTEIVEEN